MSILIVRCADIQTGNAIGEAILRFFYEIAQHSAGNKF